MLLTDEDIKERIESPLNLMNRLRTVTERHPKNGSIPTHPAIPPTSDSIIDNLEDKIKSASTRTKATNILYKAMTELELRMREIQKPEKLAQIATEMSKVISNQDNKPSGGHTSQIIIYAPQVQSLDNFEIIDVAE